MRVCVLSVCVLSVCVCVCVLSVCVWVGVCHAACAAQTPPTLSCRPAQRHAGSNSPAAVSVQLPSRVFSVRAQEVVTAVGWGLTNGTDLSSFSSQLRSGLLRFFCVSFCVSFCVCVGREESVRARRRKRECVRANEKRVPLFAVVVASWPPVWRWCVHKKCTQSIITNYTTNVRTNCARQARNMHMQKAHTKCIVEDQPNKPRTHRIQHACTANTTH